MAASECRGIRQLCSLETSLSGLPCGFSRTRSRSFYCDFKGDSTPSPLPIRRLSVKRPPLDFPRRVASDGEDGMRSLVGKLFNDNEQHILDWYHIARRFEAIGKGLVYLPSRGSEHWREPKPHLNPSKWKSGTQPNGASIALSNLRRANHASLRRRIRPVDGRAGLRADDRNVVVLHSANQSRLINAAGNTAKAIAYRRHAWSQLGPTGGLADGEKAAHALDPTLRSRCCYARCALLNGELGKHTHGRPQTSSLARRHEPRFFQSRSPR